MPEDANRYFIVMFLENKTEAFTDKKDIDEFLLSYNKSNRDVKNPLVYGRLETLHSSNPHTWVVKYSVYKKITAKYPLETFEKHITKNFEDESELKNHFSKDAADGEGKMYIGYMYNGEVRTIPIFYKKDSVFVNYESLVDLMAENYNNETFLSGVWSNKKFNAPEYRKKVEFYLERLQIAYGKYILYIGDEELLANGVKAAIRDFMKAWCVVDGKINQRKVREAGSIVKNCLSKAKTPEKKKIRERKISNPSDDIRLF